MEFWRRFSCPPPIISSMNEELTLPYITTILSGRNFGQAQGTGTIASILDDDSVITIAVLWCDNRVVFTRAEDRDVVSVTIKNFLGYATQWYA